MTEYIDQAQWFDSYPSCRSCKKTAEGMLMGRRNENLGYYCKKHGLDRLKKAQVAQRKHEEQVRRMANDPNS